MRLTILLTVLACLSGAGRAATYYVSAAGCDTNAGVAPERAFLTITRGVEALAPGDTLMVAPGVYREEVFIEKSGAADRPITIKAEIAGRAELVGSVRLAECTPMPGHPMVFTAPLAQPAYLVYEKDTDTELIEMPNLAMVEEQAGSFFYDADRRVLVVHPSDDRGMQHHVVDACVLNYGLASLTTPTPQAHAPRRVGLIVDGFVVRDFNTYGIFIHNADDCVIRNCVVHHCRRGIFTSSALRSRITGCEAFACADRFNREQGNIGMMGYIFECLLESNIVYNTRQYGIRFYGNSYGNVMRGNLAYQCEVGIHIKGEDIPHDRAVYFARFSDGGKPRLTPGITNRFERNAAHQISGAGLLPGFNIYQHNTGEKCMSGRALAPRSNLELDTQDVATAGFVDPAWHDLRLQSDSPWRGKGFKGEDPGACPYNGDVFFVSPAGSDTNTGTCAAAAWRTLAHAAARIKAGQTLYLAGGTYAEALVLRNLEAAGQPTCIRAHGKGAVYIDGRGKQPVGVDLADCRNVNLQGLRIRNTAAQAVRLANAESVRVEECEVFDNAGEGIRIEGRSADVRVLNNTIVHNGGAGVTLDAAAGSVWIVNNILRSNAAALDLESAGPGLYCDYNNLDGAAPAGAGAHNVDLDPGFVNAGERDFRLAPISLCRGRGYLGRSIGTGRREPAQAETMAITGVCVVGVTTASADLAWTVRGGKATMIVAYGTNAAGLTNVIVRDTGHWYRRRHSTTLAGLQPGARYYVRVGYRRLLDSLTPYHSFNYAWPERTPSGEAAYYDTLSKQDTLDDRVVSFETPLTGTVSSRVIHVSSAGDDAAGGASNAPLRTLGCACARAFPGDRVVVHQGTYVEMLRPARSGVPGHPIVFEAAPGERVEINGGRELIPYGADLRGRRHIVIRGFIFFGQTEYEADDGGFGQVAIVDAADIRVESCVFDGRMNYVNGVSVYDSRDVVLHNNLFVSHHAGVIAYDNAGTLTVTRNSFLGPTLGKIYAPRCERLVIRNNLFGEHLFPKKKLQYKLKLPLVRALDCDYNCYYFDPRNDERRIVDYMPPITDTTEPITALPENDANKKRVGVKGSLAAWQRDYGQDIHSLVTTNMLWADPGAVARARSRARGWPNRFFNYDPIQREDLRLAPDSPCLAAGENGVNIGADTRY